MGLAETRQLAFDFAATPPAQVTHAVKTLAREESVTQAAIEAALERIAAGEPLDGPALRRALINQKLAKGAGRLKLTAAGRKLVREAQEERRRRAELRATLALLPATVDGLIEEALRAIDAYHAAILADNRDAAEELGRRLDLIERRAHDPEEGDCFGIATEESPAQVLRDAVRAPAGRVPTWGQAGLFLVEHDGTRYLIEHAGRMGSRLSNAIYAPTLDPFPSETGYRSFLGSCVPVWGRAVDEYWKAAIGAHLKGGKHDKLPKLIRPRTAYRLPEPDERCRPIPHMGYLRSYDLKTGENRHPEIGAPTRPEPDRASFVRAISPQRDSLKNWECGHTALGPDGAEYWIGSRCAPAGWDHTLYRRAGNTIEKVATAVGEDRFLPPPKLAERAGDMAFGLMEAA